MSARHRRQAEQPPTRGTVLFVHGLWMNGVESFMIRRYLAAHGMALRVLPYSSLAESMDVVARRCARFVKALARRTGAPVHLIGHSMGGLVVYRMFQLGLLPPGKFSGDFCRVVFMGTPILGSQSARALVKLGPARGLIGKVGASCLPRGVSGRWEYPAQLGIIAGNRAGGLGLLLTHFEGPNDGTVAVAETRLAGAADFIELPVSHTSMCLSRKVAEEVAWFLSTGHFQALSRR